MKQQIDNTKGDDAGYLIKSMSGAKRLSEYQGVSDNLKHKFLNFYRVKDVLQNKNSSSLDPANFRKQLHANQK